MIIPVVYGKAVVKPLPVYRHDGESASYFAYVACENKVQNIKLYANGSEYDRYNVSYQGSVEHQIPDGTVLNYPHVNSILAEYPASVFEELGSSEIDVQCFCDGSVIYDLVSKETVASYNPVNFIYDFMTSTKYGMGIKPDMLSINAFEAEALYAEHYDLINTCAFGVVLDSESTTENLNKLLLHANAELFNSEGLIHIAIKRQRPVSADISQFVVKGSVRFKQGTLSDTVGRVRITTHTVPEWNTMQAVIDSELDYTANEEAVEYDYIEDLELPLVFARHKMDRTNYNDTVELEIAHMGLILDPCDVVNLDYSDYDLNGRYLVKSVSYPTPFTVGLVLLPDPVSLYDNVEGNFSEGVYSVYDSTLSAPAKITNINISETVETLADGSYLIVLTASWLSAERASSYSVTVINGGISQSATTKGLMASFRVVPGSASVSISAVSYSNVFSDAYSVDYNVSGMPVAPKNVSNLTYGLIRNGIRLTWLKSASSDVLRYDIYVADVFYVSVSGTEYVCPVTDEGTFVFKIFTVARSGIKSSGASISVTIQKPSAPTALTATPKLYSIGLDAVFTKDSLFDGLEIWAGITNSRSSAEHLATVQTGRYDHSNLDLVTGFYYWVRVRNIFGLQSDWFPFSATAGVFGQTDSDPSKLLETLKGSADESLFISKIAKGILNIPAISGAITGDIALEDDIVEEDVVVLGVDGSESIVPRLLAAQLLISEHDGIIATHQKAIYDDNGILASIGTIQSSVAVIEDDIGDIIAEWTIKTVVNGKIAGVGLMNTGVLSEFAVLADAFRVALSSEDEDPVQAFIVGLINGSAAVGINGDLYIDGSVTARAVGTNLLITSSANIGDAVINDAHILDLSADKIHAGTLDANDVEIINIAGENLKVTSLITLRDGGKLILGDYNIVFDTAGSGSGIATFAPDGGISGQHYMTLNNGDIQFYYWDAINGRHVEYKSLRRMESGTAFNNDTVNIDGVWKRQPKIMLSPANLQSYDSNYSGQDQSFLLEITNITVANGRYSFVPRAQLVLSENIITSVYNLTASNSSNNVTFASTAVGSPGNTVKIRASVKLASVRSNGTTGVYMYRTVSWRIVAGTVASEWKAVQLGATLDFVADTAELVVSQGQYNVSIEAKAYDTGSNTFSTGGTGYDYWNGSSDYFDKTSHPVVIITNASQQLIMPDVLPAAGYTIYQVDWEITYMGYGVVDCGIANKTINKSSSNPAGSGTIITSTSTAWNTTVVFTPIQASNLTIQRVRAVVKASKVISASTTPANSLILEVVTYDVAGAVMLAQGSINWWAIGE